MYFSCVWGVKGDCGMENKKVTIFVIPGSAGCKSLIMGFDLTKKECLRISAMLAMPNRKLLEFSRSIRSSSCHVLKDETDIDGQTALSLRRSKPCKRVSHK